MSSSRLSIGLPVFNGARLLPHALDSICTQDFEDWEMIVSDNASTDATEEICRQYARKDSRIRYLRQPENIGVAANHNRVFALARAPFFKWAHHDVVCLPGMVRRCMEVMNAAPASVVLVSPLCELIDEGNHFGSAVDELYSIATHDPRPYRRLATVVNRITWVNQLHGVMRSAALRQTRLIDTFPSCDHVLLAELALLGELWEIPELLLRRNLEPKADWGFKHRNQAWRKWLDPHRKAERSWLPERERLVREYVRSIRRMPLDPMERTRCILTVIITFYSRVLLRKMGIWQRLLRPSAAERVT